MSSHKTGHRRRRYVPNTPVGRLRSTVEKICFHAALAEARLRSWAWTDDKRVTATLTVAASMLQGARALLDLVGVLESSDFVPRRRSEASHFDDGQLVRVSPKYSARYLEAHPTVFGDDGGLLECLRVVKELSSGEYLVRCGDDPPFPARKTHLLPAREKSLPEAVKETRRAAKKLMGKTILKKETARRHRRAA